MLSIALTKGRLKQQAAEYLGHCGYGTEVLRNKGRSLVFADSEKDVSYFLVKTNDCVTYVTHGVADVGIVGKDTLLNASISPMRLRPSIWS